MGEAAQRIDAAQRRLLQLWSDALRDAGAAYAARLVPPPLPGVGAEALHALYDGWSDCAEDAYARMAHSETYCSTLAELVNAGSHWRRDLLLCIEQSAKLLDLPTRREVNTLTQRLMAVEKRLRPASSVSAAKVSRGGRRAPRKPKS